MERTVNVLYRNVDSELARSVAEALCRWYTVLCRGCTGASSSREMTASTRAMSRGCPPRWLRNLYRFAPVPDITFYFRAPLDVAVNRILSGRPKLKYYEAGMDLGLSYDRSESFRLFQARILEEYDKMVESDNFVVLDGTLPVNKLQKQMRDIVASKIDLKRFAPHAAAAE